MPMGSLIEELQRREAAARQEVDELRGEIAQLNDGLARAEERLSRLEITRETVAEILGAERPMAGRGAEAAAAAGPAPADSRVADGSPVGVVTVPPWRPGLAGREHRRRGRAEHREVQDRGPALETETAGGTRLAGRGRARAVYAAPP